MKYLLIFFLLAQSFLFAQEPEVVLTTGHTDMVTSIDYNKDGSIMATGSLDKLVKLWDVKSAKELRTLSGNDGRIESVEFSPSGKFISAVLNSNQIKIWEVSTGKLIVKIENTSTYDDLDFVKDDERIIYISNDSKIVVYNIPQQKIETELPQDFVTKIKIIDNGNKFAAYTLKGEFKVFSLPDGKELLSSPVYKGEEIPQASIPMYLSPDGKTIALTLFNNKVHFLDVTTGKEIAVMKDHAEKNNLIKAACFKGNYFLSADAIKSVVLYNMTTKKIEKKYQLTDFYPSCLAPHPQQDLFVLGDFKKILVCNLLDGKVNKVFESKARRILNMAYDQQGKYLATASDEINIKIWNLAENKIERSIMGFFPLTFTTDGKKLITMYNSIGLAVWNPATGEKLQELNTEYELIQTLAVSSDGKYLGGAGFMGILKVWDLSTGKLIKKFTGHAGGIYGISFSPDGKTIATAGMDQTVKVWNFESGKEIKTLEGHEILVSDVQFTPNGKYLLSCAWDKKIKVWNTNDWSLNKTIEGHVNMLLDIDVTADSKYVVSASGNNTVSPADNTIRIWDIESGEMVCRLDNPTGQINKVIFEKGKDILFSCSEDGAAKIWNYKDCKQLAGLVACSGTNYLIYSPDNYYTCSQEALNSVSFRIEDKIYPFEQFDIRLNRPDIIAERLGKTPQNLVNAYKYVYKKRLKKMNFTEEQLGKDFHLPKVELVTKNIPLVTKTGQVNYKVKLSDNLYKIDRLMVYINNVPTQGSNGIDFKSKASNTIEYEISSDLMFGKNKISLSCINEKGVESMVENFEVIRENSTGGKGNLYVISIGVSEYQDNRYNLKYAAKDANDVVSNFVQTKELYANIYTKTLLNKEVTKENVNALKEFLKSTTVDDVVIVFVAGHGLLDEKLDYYYASHDVNFDNPSAAGIPYEEIEALFNNIKAIKKILFMDTCHSGELDKDEVQSKSNTPVEKGDVSFRAVGEGVELKNPFGVENSIQLTQSLFGNLKKGTGTTVISSAGGAEFAMESDTWKNGLFTYCLLNGLSLQMADVDLNKQIFVSELQKYVSQEVKTLSKGKQQPTAREQNLDLDFRLK